MRSEELERLERLKIRPKRPDLKLERPDLGVEMEEGPVRVEVL